MAGQPARNYAYRNLVGTQVIQLATNVGTLHTVVVNRTGGGPIQIVDGAGGTTAIIGTLKASVAEATYLYDCCFGIGLRIGVGADSDITVTWNQGS